MTNYTEWWEGLSLALKIYWGIAIPCTLLFLLQLVLTFFGGDHVTDDTPDAEVQGDTGIHFQFLTVKNLITFLTIFSWTGIACLDSGLSELLSFIIAFISGLLMMLLMATIFYYLSKANADGTMKISKALGSIGQVYLIIAKNRGATGQVQIKVQGSLRTLDAITDDEEDIPTGTMVTVKSIVSNNILLVTAK